MTAAAAMPQLRSGLLCAAVLSAALTVPATAVLAHPHVFVDGGVDFVVTDRTKLEALEVTWLIDEFETLYLLSDYGLSLNEKGGLDEEDRLELIRLLGDWPEDFEGSAHLSVDGAGVALDLPTNLDARLVDGRLLATFTRRLATPVQLGKQHVEVAFYEATYYYAFFVTNRPKMVGRVGDCSARVIPFNADEQQAELQTALAKLGREETPDITDVGALFADRIVVQCG